MIKVFEPCLTKEDLDFATKEYLRTGQLDPGNQVELFEAEIAAYLGVPAHWVMLTSSCTAALHACYHFLLEKNEVLQAPILTWPGTYCTWPHIRFYDEAPEEFAPAVVVDLYGRGILPDTPARPLIIDAAHNCLSRDLVRDWLLAGKADAICFSFGPTKQLTTIRGGCVVSPHVSGRWRAFIHYGAHERQPIMPTGGNYNMPDFNAAIGREQLKRFGQMQTIRLNLLSCYWGNLEAEIIGRSGHICSARLSPKIGWKSFLHNAGIQTSHHYPLPHVKGKFPWSEELSQFQVTLPLHLELTPNDIVKICSTINKAIKQ